MASEHFEAFDNYLALQHTPDSWGDWGTVHARGLVASFDERDWELVAQSWQTRPASWQMLCADVLDITAHARALPIVTDILLHGMPEAALQAAFRLSYDTPADWNPPREVRDAVHRVLAGHPGAWQREAIATLAARLDNPTL